MTKENNETQIPLMSSEDTKLLPSNISSFPEDDIVMSLMQSNENKLVKLKGMFTVSTSAIQNQVESPTSIATSIINLFPMKLFKERQTVDQKQKRKNIIFTPITPDEIRFNNGSSFGYIQCKMITTYFLGRVSYSEFTNPQMVEKESKMQLAFLYQSKCSNSNDHFSLDVIEDALSISTTMSMSSSNYSPFAKLSNIDPINMKQFINELNNFFYESEYINIANSYSQNNCCYISLMVLIMGILLSIVLFLSLRFSDMEVWQIVLAFFFVIALVFLGWVFWKKRSTLPFRQLESELIYRFNNVDKVQLFIDQWNETLFLKHDIYMWIPVSLHYVMFNMDINQEIQIKGHQIDEKNTVSIQK